MPKREIVKGRFVEFPTMTTKKQLKIDQHKLSDFNATLPVVRDLEVMDREARETDLYIEAEHVQRFEDDLECIDVYGMYAFMYDELHVQDWQFYLDLQAAGECF